MEQEFYTTLSGEGRSEYTEKKSVFLGYAKRAESEEHEEFHELLGHTPIGREAHAHTRKGTQHSNVVKGVMGST